MRAIADGDLVLGTQTGTAAGPEIPPGLAGSPLSTLRVVDGAVVDATGLTRFWIDAAGVKHAAPLKPEWQELACSFGAVLYRDGDVWKAESAAETKRAALMAEAASIRWDRQNGGVDFEGVRIDTDIGTVAFLNGAYVSAKEDAKFTVPNWRLGPGQYVELTAVQIIAIATAVRDHIQNCFAVNAEADAKIADGDIVTRSDLLAFFAARLP